MPVARPDTLEGVRLSLRDLSDSLLRTQREWRATVHSLEQGFSAHMGSASRVVDRQHDSEEDRARTVSDL